MDNNNAEVRKIIQDLYSEFLEEEKSLSEKRDSHLVRIDELDQKINNYKKNDDVDFKVFSPRNNLNINTDKILELEREKKELEIECKSSDKQIRYYSDKLVKLEKVLELLNAGVNNTSHFEFDYFDEYEDAIKDNKDASIFDELFPSNKNDIQVEENSIESSIKEISVEKNNDEDPVIDTFKEKDEDKPYISPGSIARIIHKAEFTEKIISNDTIRAKLEIKEIIKSLKELIK